MDWQKTNYLFLAFAVGIAPNFGWAAKAASPVYTVLTFKNNQKIGKRAVSAAELHHAASELVIAFQENPPTYEVLIEVAKSMTAKDRCFNLYSSRITLASVQSGLVDASANAEEFLVNSIRSIGEVNDQTQVTCDMK
jgi:hypothetical protein